MAENAAPQAPAKKPQEKTFDMDKLRAELNGATAAADAKASAPKYRSSGSRETILVTLKVMFYISLVAVLLYYVIRFLKKGMLGRGWSKHLGSRSIEILESAALGANKTLNLVKIADRMVLLGVSEREIRFLTSFEDEKTVRAILKNNEETAPAVAVNFSQSVNAFLSRLRKENRVQPLSAAVKQEA